MPRIRGRSNASSLALSLLTDRDPDDPFRDFLQPPPNETPSQREERIHSEREAKRISDEIDEQLRREKAVLKKISPVRVLLLGQSESGKSTTLKNFQIHYAPQSWQEERACWRAVIQLNLIRSVSLVLDTCAASPIPLSPEEATQKTNNEPLASRYAPLLARLEVAERLIRSRLSPADTEEPGDYRSFTASLFPNPSLRNKPLVPPQEFFIRSSGAGSWKSRFMRRVSNASNPSHVPRTSSDTWRKDATDEATAIVEECREDMSRLWGDPEVQSALDQQSKGRPVEDTPGFFLHDVNRIAAHGYEPSDDDVIRARLRTMGVQEHRFTFERGYDSGREWRIYDIGGARSQRTSWLSFFDEVDAIIFLAPISCFDEVLVEDPRTNRLEDSIVLWRSLCRSPLLVKVQLVLFLNKVDLLRRKINNGALISRYITSFGERSNDVETVCKYLKQKFKEIQKQYSPIPRPYYVYFTSVTDTKTTGVTLGIVREGILRANLQRADFL